MLSLYASLGDTVSLFSYDELLGGGKWNLVLLVANVLPLCLTLDVILFLILRSSIQCSQVD
jgi:hypothetical protein